VTSDQPGFGVRPIHDARMLRAIAHPARNRILSELSASGPMRAADVARDLDIPANQASFHLRQLAKYGLVEEAPEEARDKRDRVWRVAAERGVRVNLRELEESPGGKAAVSVFRRTAAARGYRVIDEAYSTEGPKGTFRSVTDESIKLTKDEAVELAAELDDLLVRWGARTRGRKGSRRTYQVFQVIQPYPEAGEDHRAGDRPESAG
jgi:DNA-binding transcriptional ArsR family regulator